MADKNSSDFRKFCGDDIEKLHQERDPTKKPHLLRRISAQMYAEACKLNYSDFMVCKILSDDLEEYIQHSAPVQQKKFENMMKELNIDVKPGTLKSKLQKPVEKFPDTAKCEGICQNEKLLDDLDNFFNSSKKQPTPIVKPSSTPPVSSVSIARSNSIKISVDESNGDLVFDTNFKPKRTFSQNIARNEPVPSTSTSHDNRFSVRENQTNTNQTPFISTQINNSPDSRYGNRFKPVETVSTNPYSSYGAIKRKRDEHGNDFYKQPNYPEPKPEPVKDDPNPFMPKNDFKSASEELEIQYNKKYGGGNQSGTQQNDAPYNSNPIRRTLGGRRTVNNKFVPPYATNQDNNSNNSNNSTNSSNLTHLNSPNNANQPENSLALKGIDMSHPRLKNVDLKMAETISNEIMDQCDLVDWDSIAGLQYAKKILKEAVVLPILRPDIFTGLRQPPRGVLLFGPPGTGKTLIGKCIASQSESTFFSISASSLTSKWIGEGEKMVRALFAVAAALQPSVVFIDEVDSLLCQRSENEHESSRRLKTEFLVQLDGTTTTEKDRILIVGATNRPQELDEAARRRFVKRLYIPLPDFPARREILLSLLSSVDHVITESQFEEIAHRSDGFSGADMKVLCQEAVMGPIRSISFTDMRNVAADSVRAVTFTDFLDAMKCVRASVSQDDLQQYVDWNNTYGSGNAR